MSCYKDGGCGVYEMYSCHECPASKPEYLKKKEREPQTVEVVVELRNVTKQIMDSELLTLLRQYGAVVIPSRMGEECRVPKWLLALAANRIEELKNAAKK